MFLRLFVVIFCALQIDSTRAADPEFSVDVMAILSKAGCNAGTCHGNLNGKGGLKLSLRGQDPRSDFVALVQNARGRRVDHLIPTESLFLLKATGSLAHEGGVRFEQASREYRTLLNWVQQGASPPSNRAPKLTRLVVRPEQAVVFAPQSSVQVQVTAVFDDGGMRDVTQLACYELSNLFATVDTQGKVTKTRNGETTLIVRYLQIQVPVPIAFAAERSKAQLRAMVTNNSIDTYVQTKLQGLHVNASDLCSDSTFVRRAYLDAIGRLPTAEEARQFVRATNDDKRIQLIDRLLARPEFSDFWALKWADILRTEEKVLDTRGVEVFHAWIRDCVATAKPIDQFVRELVTGVGSTFDRPSANYYRANRDPQTRGETTARLFLGTRLQCAKCHNHPFDRWTQEDYYAWSSIFSQLDYELSDAKRKDKLDKNEFAGDQTVLVSKQPEVRNPTSGDVALPKYLGGDHLPDLKPESRLPQLAEWLTSRDNDVFAKSQVNFVWFQLMGRGLVEPIDDFRLTNPATNPALLDQLAADFVRHEFDLRFLVRSIMRSRVYQLDSRPTESNAADESSFSRAYTKRYSAEVLLDMQSDVLQSPADFAGYPAGIRAVQIPGVQRVRLRDEAPHPGDRFLKTFGKPERIMACDCERSNETTFKQALILIGDGLNGRLDSQDEWLERLSNSKLDDQQIVEELYWTALSRPPTRAERQAALSILGQGTKRRLGDVKDLCWALLNAKEFLFRH